MKAYVLYSGGLDSIVAINLLQGLGFEVIAVHFTSPFFGNPEFCKKVSEEQKFKLIIKKVKKNYYSLLRKPKFGYGSEMNPCIDCHLYMLKELKKLVGKNIIVTGEVLGQRPMSQKLDDLLTIEKKAGLKRKVLRPLSAKLLPETEYEKRGLVDRSKLWEIKGRNRKKQLEFAKKHKLNFLTPSGGCLLAEKEYAKKLRDAFKFSKIVSERDFELLKLGRHFRIKESKIIVGRNEKENYRLKSAKREADYLFEVDGIGPTTLLIGKKHKEAIELAAKLTLSYSDESDKRIKYGRKLEKELFVSKIDKKNFEKFRI